MALDDADGLIAHGRAAPQIQAGKIVPRRQDFATVGHLYRSIEASFHRLAEKFGVRAGSMPCDGAWPAEQVEAFARWVDGGTPP